MELTDGHGRACVWSPPHFSMEIAMYMLLYVCSTTIPTITHWIFQAFFLSWWWHGGKNDGIFILLSSKLAQNDYLPWLLNVETSHYLSEISKSREKRILKMLWKCQIFPLRVPVVIEMCCCVGKCPVGSQKTILSYAPIADRECHCHFLVWMLSLIRKRWDLHYHWPLVIW